MISHFHVCNSVEPWIPFIQLMWELVLMTCHISYGNYLNQYELILIQIRELFLMWFLKWAHFARTVQMFLLDNAWCEFLSHRSLSQWRGTFITLEESKILVFTKTYAPLPCVNFDKMPGIGQVLLFRSNNPAEVNSTSRNLVSISPCRSFIKYTRIREVK